MWPLDIPGIAIPYNNQIVNSDDVNDEMTKSWRKSNNQWRKNKENYVEARRSALCVRI